MLRFPRIAPTEVENKKVRMIATLAKVENNKCGGDILHKSPLSGIALKQNLIELHFSDAIKIFTILMPFQEILGNVLAYSC